MFVPMPISRFILTKLISSFFFIFSAIMVVVVKNKLEDKRFQNERKNLQRSRPM